MGPSYQGTYSDAEMCHCRGHYVDSNTALLHNHHNVRGHYSDNENPYHRGHSCSDSEHYHQVRQCVYSGEESDFEPHYLEQTASGNVFIPGLFNFVSCSTEKKGSWISIFLIIRLSPLDFFKTYMNCDVLITDGQPRFPRTVPRSGSVPMSRSGELVSPQPVRPQCSNTVPSHFMNGDHHNSER